ncbi:MAG: hypothetical protein ACO1TE_08235 [Prosthecobacter sp.]
MKRINSFGEIPPEIGCVPKLLEQFSAYLPAIETGCELGCAAGLASA